MPRLDQLKRDVVRVCHRLHEKDFVAALDGNVSVRLEEDRVLCTRTMVPKAFVTEDDLVVIDMRGRKVSGSGQPTSEMAMHLAAYRSRPDVKAVVHAHPPTAVAFTIAGVSLARCVLPEVVMTMHAIPTVRYQTTGTYELADGLTGPLRRYDAVMMDRHGAVCVGPDLWTAYWTMEKLEHAASITLKAHQLGRVQELPGDEVERLKRLGEKYGVPGLKPEDAARLAADEARREGEGLPSSCVGCTGCQNPARHGIGSPLDIRVARVTSRRMAVGHGGVRLGAAEDGPGAASGPGGPRSSEPPLPAGSDGLIQIITEEIARALSG